MRKFLVPFRAVKATRNHLYRQLDGSKIKPRLLVYEVTRRCNSRCVHCNIWRTLPPNNDLTLRELNTILGDSLFCHLDHVILTGGEPSLRMNLLDIILAFYRRNPKMLVWYSTNGLLVEKICKTVEKSLHKGVNLGVGISLDGVGDSHDKSRGVKGAFKKADTLIRSLIKMETPKISVGFTLSNETAHNYWSLKHYCDSLGVHLLVQMFDHAPFYGHQNVAIEKATREVRKVVESLPESLLKERWVALLNGRPKNFDCYAMHTFFVLRQNGEVSPCFRLYDQVFGNMNFSDPTNVWCGSRACGIRETVKTCNPQCLNDWALNYSLKARYFPVFFHKLLH